jgi:hypothetical protein
MINKVLFLFALLLLFSSCKNGASEKEDALKNGGVGLSRNELKSSIKQMEDSITGLLQNKDRNKLIPSLTYIELINRLKSYYQRFPNDPYSSQCLFNIHIQYSSLNANELAIAYGDTLLSKFPNFPNSDLLLESMATTYDIYIVPRDTTNVRKYYTLLLNQKGISSQKRKDTQERLKHIELGLFDYITYQSKHQAKNK